MLLPGSTARGYVGAEGTVATGRAGLLNSTLPAGPKAAVLLEMGSTLVLMLTPWLLLHGIVNCSRTLAIEKPARSTESPLWPSTLPRIPGYFGRTYAAPAVGDGKWMGE